MSVYAGVYAATYSNVVVPPAGPGVAGSGGGPGRPRASQVVTYAPDGTAPRWLGAIGHVTGLKYSFACPGGADQMTCVLQVDARYRTDALNPGRIVQIVRGTSVVWDGKLDEPTPGAAGWTVTAHGAGTYGTDFMAQYSGSWASTMPDAAINNAISRGLRWVNYGTDAPPGAWLSQMADSASITITDLLNLVCDKGGLTWYVSTRPRGNALTVISLPATTVTRLLVSNTPVARTLGGDVNTIWIRYQHDADANVPAVFATTSVTEPKSVTAHGPMETYMDISSAGTYTAVQAQAVGNKVLQRYQRASFAGPFAVNWGQLLTTGGQPVDLGMEQAGGVCRLILTDYGYGGEISPAPVQFLVGAYEYDDDAQVATVTPFQSLQSNFSSLLAEIAANAMFRKDPRPRVKPHRKRESRATERRERRDEAWHDKHPHYHRPHHHPG